MKIIPAVLMLVLTIQLGGCESTSTSGKDGYKALLKQAFQAIKQNDWDKYSKLTITEADFDLKQNKVSPFKQKQSYVGSVLKPEQQQQQRQDFQRAITGGEGIIPFATAEYVSVGSVVSSGTAESLAGAAIPYTVYSLKVKSGGSEFDSQNLEPLFVVTQWQGEYRLLNLYFKPR